MTTYYENMCKSLIRVIFEMLCHQNRNTLRDQGLKKKAERDFVGKNAFLALKEWTKFTEQRGRAIEILK